MRGHAQYRHRSLGTPATGFDRSPGSRWYPQWFLGSISWSVAVVGLVAWSMFAALVYVLTEPVLSWIVANLGFLVTGGKVAATTAGAGKEAGVLLNNLDTIFLGGQVIALLRAVLKPAIIVVWGLGGDRPRGRPCPP